MHAPSVIGTTISWPDGGKVYTLPPLDLDAELAFQQALEDAAWSRLPKPGHPARAEAVDGMIGKVAGNEFAFGGPMCLRALNTNAGVASYLHFLMFRGHKVTGGKAAVPPPAADLERRLREEAHAGEGAAVPLTELWLKVVARDFPFSRSASPSPSSETPGTGAPSTPA